MGAKAQPKIMMRRRLTQVFIGILLSMIGYNLWQVHQLEAQVKHLQAELSAKRHTRLPEAAARSSWFDRANEHLARGEDALERGNLVGGQRELALAASSLRQAAQEPLGRTQATLAEAQRMRAKLMSAWQTLEIAQKRLQTLQAQAEALGAKAGPPLKALQHQVMQDETSHKPAAH